MLFHIVEEENENPYIAEGTWTNPRTEKSLPMKNFSTNDDALTGRINVTDYLDYEDPQNIGREYVYSIWNPRYGSMMGGNVKFRGAGKYKLHFEVSNVPGNIAEGKSAPDRPAVLGESTHNYFYYENVNECGYGFSAHFFKKFVVLKSTTKYETFGCFGMGVAESLSASKVTCIVVTMAWCVVCQGVVCNTVTLVNSHISLWVMRSRCWMVHSWSMVMYCWLVHVSIV